MAFVGLLLCFLVRAFASSPEGNRAFFVTQVTSCFPLSCCWIARFLVFFCFFVLVVFLRPVVIPSIFLSHASILPLCSALSSLLLVSFYMEFGQKCELVRCQHYNVYTLDLMLWSAWKTKFDHTLRCNISGEDAGRGNLKLLTLGSGRVRRLEAAISSSENDINLRRIPPLTFRRKSWHRPKGCRHSYFGWGRYCSGPRFFLWLHKLQAVG